VRQVEVIWRQSDTDQIRASDGELGSNSRGAASHYQHASAVEGLWPPVRVEGDLDLEVQQGGLVLGGTATAVVRAQRRDLNASILREGEGGPQLTRWLIGPVSLTLRVSGV
jgi:hypothetical protein